MLGSIITQSSSSAGALNMGINTINGDSGSASGSTLTLTTGQAANNCGSTIFFSAAGSTIELNIIDNGGNLFFGTNAGSITHTGQFCLGLGVNAGANYEDVENSNLTIGHPGNSGENNVLRIGQQGTGDFQQNIAYIAGNTPVQNITADFTIPDTQEGVPAPFRIFVITEPNTTLKLPANPLVGERFYVINQTVGVNTVLINANGNEFEGIFSDAGTSGVIGNYVSWSYEVFNQLIVTPIADSQGQWADMVWANGKYICKTFAFIPAD